MSTVHKLRAAKALIEDPAHWCQGAAALDKNGRSCGLYEAVRWCVLGACWHENVKDYWLLEADVNRHGLVWINDRLGHKAIMELFDRAIELASIEETPDER